ncbi:MAG TPA: sigma-70 family RNA polymerase sigma factor, partial [Polyangiaceae bacterium]
DVQAPMQTERPEVLALFNENLDLVNVIAGRMSRDLGPVINFEDIIAAGREGLFAAARRYDAAREVTFRVYANYRIRGAILDAVRKSARLPRRAYERLVSLEAATLVNEGEAAYVFNRRTEALTDVEAETYLDEHLATVVTAATAAAQQAANLTFPDAGDADYGDPEQALAQAELLTLIKEAIADLDEVEGKIIELMYFAGHSLEHVSVTLRISKPWACRLHARAMSRLTKRLRRFA